jgi:hypothetical protein
MPGLINSRMAGGPGSDLEQRLAKLESVIKVENDGSVTIECNNKIKIRAATSVEIEAATTVIVKGGANVEVQASASLNLKAAAVVNVQGSVVKLNGGNRPLARVGDIVLNPTGAPGIVQGGCATVLA